MVKFNGTITALDQMKNIFKFFSSVKFDRYIDGVYAHDYKDDGIRQEIFDTYNKKYRPEPTPLTHPERFNPLNPPEGWAYDPYYEIWIEI